jgi:hypothetical protein
MTLLQGCEWLQRSWIGSGIRGSRWGFAAIEVVHLLAVALLGGALMVTGLRIFGLILPDRRPVVVLRDLARPMAGSLVALIFSGVLLFLDGPLRYYANVAFRSKLALLAGALLAAWATYWIALGYRGSPTTPAAVKVMTLVSLILWLGVGIAGRVIGVL